MRSTLFRASILGGIGAGLLAAASPAGAVCSAGSPPIVADLQTAILGDPARVLKQIDQRLAQPALGRIDRAWLYAAQALAYSTLEMNPEEIRAAEAGLRLAPDPRDAPHIELLAQLAYGQSSTAAVAPIRQRIEAARRFVQPGSIADICSRATLGYLSEKPAERLRLMSDAYRMAMQQGLEAQRAEIAIDLADPIMGAGDYDQAQGLLDESGRWADENRLTFQSASIAFRSGMILIGKKDFARTLPYFDRAYDLARSIGNDHFAAFAALALCQSYVSLDRFPEAQRACDNAQRLFGAETIAQARLIAFRSRIALGLKHYDEAIALSNVLLGGPASRSMGPTAAYKTRGDAYAGLGRYKEAYADLSDYIARYRKETEASRTRETASLRTQVEIDRQIDRNKALNREIAFQDERAHYERQRFYLIAGTGAALILLLGLFLWNSRRHQRALKTLASQDGLTRIPNRRSATERGTEALSRAADARTPLSVALLDIDHFKQINDSQGHAAGDAALTALAGVLKTAVRRSDIVGRWGGEEFVVILPGIEAPEAGDVIARIRTAAARLDHPLRFSAGIAVAGLGERSLEAIVARADAALYEAKRSGRDRSVIADEPTAMSDRRGAPAAGTGEMAA